MELFITWGNLTWIEKKVCVFSLLQWNIDKYAEWSVGVFSEVLINDLDWMNHGYVIKCESERRCIHSINRLYLWLVPLVFQKWQRLCYTYAFVLSKNQKPFVSIHFYIFGLYDFPSQINVRSFTSVSAAHNYSSYVHTQSKVEQSYRCLFFSLSTYEFEK